MEENWKELMRPSRLSLNSRRALVGMAVKNTDRSLSNVSLLLGASVLRTLALVTPGGRTPVVSAVPPGRGDENAEGDGDNDDDDPHHARVLKFDGPAFMAARDR